MGAVLDSLSSFVPEALLVLGLALVFVLDLALMERLPSRRGIAAGVTLLTLVATGLATIFCYPPAGGLTTVFHGMAVVDAYGRYFEILLVVAGAIVTVLAARSPEIHESLVSEFFALLLAMTFGMFLLVSANSILMIFMALEFVSIVSYILTALKRHDRRASEAALKYVIYGALASGIMLFGFSYLYGLTGSLDINEIGRELAGHFGAGASPANRLIVSVAVVMVLAGFGFKIAAVPFHMWCPDVYEGAPTPVTAMLSVAPKAAGFAALLRFCAAVLGNDAASWSLLIGVVAVLTMTLGNLAAVVQDNVKRLLAYSGIAHAGFMLTGVAVASREAVWSVMFYLGVYLLMNLGAFVVVIAVRNSTGGREDIDAYRGLSQRNLPLALTMAVFLFSLVGMPPFGGFIGKIYVLASLLSAGGPWFQTLAVIAVINTAISLYYYARIVRAMFLTPPADDARGRLGVDWLSTTLAIGLALPVLTLGIYWAPLRFLVQASPLALN